jgi:hypothetical protein
MPSAETQIVVEGYISTDTFAYVLLTKNTPFFSTLDSSQLQQYIVHGAEIIVSDGMQSDTMVEINYGQLTVYVALNLRGEAGKTYSLHVEAEGNILTAETFIPLPIPLDSVWWKQNGTVVSEVDSKPLGFAWAHLTDPDTLGNCYRWFAKRVTKDERFLAPIGSTFEDKFINGKSFDFGYDRGRIPDSRAQDDTTNERGYFKQGDTIIVKFCAIDRSNFVFWRDVETQVSNNGNPFSNPAPIHSNINGGLGVWGGYAATYDTIYAR